MWTCRHCNQEFPFERVTDKGNHVKHCDANPAKAAAYANIRKAVSARHDAEYGEVKPFTVCCEICETDFVVNEREQLFPQQAAYYCSKRCANAVGGRAKAIKHHPDSKAHYRTVAFRHRDKHCYACGHDRIIEVHHLDHNHKNNDPKNLIPLCSNHHKMMHSRWRSEVLALLESREHYGK